jgi:galactose mutarotase-like enzyme
MTQPAIAAGELIRLTSGGSEVLVALAGGQPTLWRVGGRDLLWSGDPEHWGWRAPVLFPVVGQVNGGRVRIDGRSYDMPRHGFARTSAFRCLDRTGDSVHLRLDKSTADTTFPLAFELDIIGTLLPDTLSLEFVVGNPGRSVLPYAVGFHPAFPWPFDGGRQESYSLWFEKDEAAEVPVIAPDGLISRERRAVPLQGNRLPLAPALFQNDALVLLNASSRRMRFESPQGSAIEMSLENFPHLAAWTKPGAPFLSLEAWTGHADPEGFEGEMFEKPSMILLPPGATSRHRVAMRFRAAG